MAFLTSFLVCKQCLDQFVIHIMFLYHETCSRILYHWWMCCCLPRTQDGMSFILPLSSPCYGRLNPEFLLGPKGTRHRPCNSGEGMVSSQVPQAAFCSLMTRTEHKLFPESQQPPLSSLASNTGTSTNNPPWWPSPSQACQAQTSSQTTQEFRSPPLPQSPSHKPERSALWFPGVSIVLPHISIQAEQGEFPKLGLSIWQCYRF